MTAIQNVIHHAVKNVTTYRGTRAFCDSLLREISDERHSQDDTEMYVTRKWTGEWCKIMCYLRPRDDRDGNDTLNLSVYYEVAHVGRAVPVGEVKCSEFRVLKV